MQIIKSREYRTAFQVEPWDIERLVDRLGGDENVSRVAVEFGDGSGATLEHAGQLATIPNLSSRPITTVWIESAPPAFLSTEDSPTRLAIIQLRDGGSSGVSYHLSGDERTVRDLAIEIDDWADSVTPWFGRLAYMDRPGLVLRGLLALGCVAGISLALPALLQGVLPGLTTAAGGGPALGARILATGSLAILAIATLWLGVRPESLFPPAQFRFGEEVSRFEHSDRIRKLVLRWSGAVAIAAVAGSTLAQLLR